MQSKKALIFALFSIFFVSQNIDAQKFIYKIENLTYFDNRVFYSPYNPQKMFFGNRFTALAGIGLNDNGQHSLYAGVTYVQPFNADYKEFKIMPMVYYKYQQKFHDTQDLHLHFGIVPYREMLMTLPSFVRKGSAEYSIPNIQGGLFQYQYKKNEHCKFYTEFAFDWRKIKNKTQRDNFGMILDGNLSKKIEIPNSTRYFDMSFGYIAQWDRLGYNLDTIKNNCDNAVLNGFVKFDFGGLTKNFKSIFVQGGYAASFNNDNFDIKNNWTQAITIDCGIQWKMISLKNNFYLSNNKNMMPLFKNYKEMFISDQYYQAPLYNKTELAFDLVKSNHFALKAQFVMHYVPDYKLGWQQKITANVKF